MNRIIGLKYPSYYWKFFKKKNQSHKTSNNKTYMTENTIRSLPTEHMGFSGQITLKESKQV